MNAFKSIYIFVHLWFFILISVFYIFDPPCFLVIWFLIASYITLLIIYYAYIFLIRDIIFWDPLEIFSESKEFCSFFISSDTLGFYIGFFSQFFFYYLGSYHLMLSNIFLECFFFTLTPLFIPSNMDIDISSLFLFVFLISIWFA